MTPWVRGILIAICVFVIFYLAYTLGVGLSDDPEMQATPSESVPQE
jgi:hypothetical protein